MGRLIPRFKYQLMSMKKPRSNTINKRVDMSKVKHAELVLYVLV
jgi:hypothetical protein